MHDRTIIQYEGKREIKKWGLGAGAHKLYIIHDIFPEGKQPARERKSIQYKLLFVLICFVFVVVVLFLLFVCLFFVVVFLLFFLCVCGGGGGVGSRGLLSALWYFNPNNVMSQ